MAISKIGSKAITDCTVVAADIAPGTITNAKLAGSIANDRLANSTVTINGTAIALGASGSIPAVSWQSVVVSDGSTVTTMVAGRGYFIDNTSAAGLVKLPISASAGDTIAIKDYAGNFGTNNLTIQRNGHKIQGNANNSIIETNRASVTLVYIDATKGWLYTNESNVADLGAPTFISATGGTVTTSGNFKIHTFTGDGCFVVASLGNQPATQNKVDYLVVAGGGGGGCGAGGAGGFRESHTAAVSGCYTASPLATPTPITVTATTFPISVGGGGSSSTSGSNSVFSTITSAGGGRAVGSSPSQGNGGSGGGGRGSYNPASGAGGTGNTPPVSPSQGNPGGAGTGPATGGGPGEYQAGGGGGAGADGRDYNQPNPGNGGDGVATLINPATGESSGCTQYYAGGGGASQQATTPAPQPASTGGLGGGGDRPHSPGSGDGTANTGGGGAGSRYNDCIPAGAGGKGIVIIRYRYQ